MTHVVTVVRSVSGPAVVSCQCGWPATQPAPHTGGRLAAARVHAHTGDGYVCWRRPRRPAVVIHRWPEGGAS